MTTSARSLVGLVALVLAVGLASAWWRQQRGADVAEQLRAELGPGELRMLSSDSCAVCLVARRWFQRHRVAFEECSIERDPRCAADYALQGAPGTPVFLARGRAMLGFDPEAMHLWLISQD